MEKQVLYYVIKYDGRYYCPFLSYDARRKYDIYEDINNMLTSDRRLAVRFPSKETAKYFADTDAQFRGMWFSYQKFDASKVRVVAVVKKSGATK